MHYEIMGMKHDDPNDDIIDMAMVVRVVAKEDATLYTQSGSNLIGSIDLIKGEVFYLSKPRGVMITAPGTTCTSVKVGK